MRNRSLERINKVFFWSKEEARQHPLSVHPPVHALQSPGVAVSRQEFCFDRLPSAVLPLVAAPPLPGCELCVAIPAHNEEAGIVRTLAALANQVDARGLPLDRSRYEILLLANNCRDATVTLARDFARAHPGLHLHVIDTPISAPHNHVGGARRLVMDEAHRRLVRLGRPRGVIASTDADTRVQPNWVAAILREVARGADAVGGRIQACRDDVRALHPGARRYYTRDLAYRTLRAAYESVLDPVPFNGWPRHHHCFGASLAVTAETYAEAGGIPVVPCLEDMAFGRELERIGARVRHSPEVGVRTSMRCQGRVEFGLSGTLTIWTHAAGAGEAWMVESPYAVETEAMHRRLVREWWGKTPSRQRTVTVARTLAVDRRWLEETRVRCTTAGELYHAVQNCQRERGALPLALMWTEVRQATEELRARLKAHRPILRGAARLLAQRCREELGADADDLDDGIAA